MDQNLQRGWIRTIGIECQNHQRPPEQIWVALPTQEGVAYMSLVTDAYSRKIVDHHVHESLHIESVIKALEKTVGERETEQMLIHHSDRRPVLLRPVSAVAYETRNQVLDDRWL